MRNDTELAAIAQQSTGILSRHSVLANHPWVDDVDKELKRLEKEERDEKEAMEPYAGVVPPNAGGEAGEEGVSEGR